jgi:hypothetical protein
MAFLHSFILNFWLCVMFNYCVQDIGSMQQPQSTTYQQKHVSFVCLASRLELQQINLVKEKSNQNKCRLFSALVIIQLNDNVHNTSFS